MCAYETRVSRAFRGAEGGADSHENVNPPDAVPRLSEAQYSAFWAGIVANRDRACRRAARIVPRHMVEDVVHSAALLFVQDAEKSTEAEPFPANPNHFRRKFLAAVRNHALNCITDGKPPEGSVHSHWGIDSEPVVDGHNLADREFDTLFARNDRGTYDAAAPTEWHAQNDLDGLRHILLLHMEELTETEREIIDETYFQEEARPEIAARRGITINTYDNHRKAACAKLRDSMTAVADFATVVDLPDWYDRAQDMNKRHAAKKRRRPSCKKVNRSNVGGDPSNFEGDPSNSRGDAK